MPTKLSLSPVPTQLQTVHRQFEQWRRTRRPGTLIPAPLWAAAVAVARRQGISRTARALHLDSHKLKTVADAAGGVPCSPASPTFVEVSATLPAEDCECTVELEGPHGARRSAGSARPVSVPATQVWCRRRMPPASGWCMGD